MRFKDFIQILKNRAKPKNQSIFIWHIFSALCGENDPVGANSQGKGKVSPCVPDGLASTTDDSSRKALFNEKSVGLSRRTRSHILDKHNIGTFVSHCEAMFIGDKFGGLCDDFCVPSTTERTIIFKATFHQFLKFAEVDHNETVDIFIAQFIENPPIDVDSSDLEGVSPICAEDNFILVRTANPPKTAQIYERINFYWQIKNTGIVPWNDRYMEIVNFDQASLKIGA